MAYRYIIIGNSLIRMHDSDRIRALEMIRDMNAEDISINPGTFSMRKVAPLPVEDWTVMTSAKAAMLLAQSGQVNVPSAETPVIVDAENITERPP